MPFASAISHSNDQRAGDGPGAGSHHVAVVAHEAAAGDEVDGDDEGVEQRQKDAGQVAAAEARAEIGGGQRDADHRQPSAIQATRDRRSPRSDARSATIAG